MGEAATGEAPRTSHGPQETERLGAEIATGLSAGDVVLVSGELGTGKTTLIRGACRELGVDGPVPSPTFTIGRRYATSPPVSHLDLYRLRSLAGEDPALLDDYLTPDAIAFVEWPDVAADEMADSALARDGRVVRVELRHLGGDAREVRVT